MISRRSLIASAVYRPCFKAFWLPSGGPDDLPPCIRHRPFDIAGLQHGRRVRLLIASQRGAAWALCMGLIFAFIGRPPPFVLDRTDNSLPAAVNVHVLDSDLLLPFAAMAIQRLCKRRRGAC